MRGKLHFVVEYCGEGDMRIVLDTYGADQGAEVFVEGAKRALLELSLIHISEPTRPY